MIKHKDFILYGGNHRPMLCDISFKEIHTHTPVVIFCHGFKGFKDWGYFPLLSSIFAEAGFAFIKINFSHNGTTPDTPVDFTDLDAFGKNTFTLEQIDLENLVHYLFSTNNPYGITEQNPLFLIGHSRGGAAVLIYATKNKLVKKVCTWAGVADLERMINPKELTKWKETGVMYSLNGRTGQQMPLYFTLREDFDLHKKEYTLQEVAPKLSQDILIIHGTDDSSVSVKEAESLSQWCPKSRKVLIEGGDHTFGGSHPWLNNHLPDKAKQTVFHTLDFFLNHLHN